MIPPPRDGPIHPDRLDHEGPLATKWGYVDPSASQRTLATGCGAVLIRLLVGPYVGVARSHLPRRTKVALIAVLVALYAAVFAALAAPLR
jgi:hypothetical protein